MKSKIQIEPVTLTVLLAHILDGKLAEVIGVLLGDGSISQYETGSRTIREIAFTASIKEREYYERFVKKVIETKFCARGRLILRGDNTVRLHFKKRSISDFFVACGVPIGRKQDFGIPRTIKRNRGLLKAFIRGVYHSEGSLYRRYSKRYAGHSKVYSDLYTIQFRMKAWGFLNELRGALGELGITTTRVTERGLYYTVRLTKQESIGRFFRLVKPRMKTICMLANSN